MKLEEYRSWGDDRLVSTINEAFNLAMEKIGDERRILLVEAEFYVTELNRREDDRVQRNRDRIETIRHRVNLGLEFLVLVLIGLELFVGLRQERNQAIAANLQQNVLNNLQASSAATVSMLTALQTTSELNAALPAEAGEHSPISIAVTYSPADRHLVITNSGRYPIYLLGYQFDGRRGPKFNPPEPLKPGQTFPYIPIEGATERMPLDPKDIDKSMFLPFSVHFKLRDGTEYSSETMLAFTRVHGEFHVSFGETIIREYTWTRPTK